MIGNLWKTSIKIKIDLHKGIHLTIGEAPPVAEFADYLNQLEEGKEYRSIWVELKTSHIPLLDLCTNKLNYTIHQGLGKDIVLNKWLSQQENKIVPYSIFWVAAGALIVHNNKVLLVQEKGGFRKGKYGLPGGRAERGELVAQCAERQLYQETGIKAKFSRIVMIREHTRDQIYNGVDVYFVCLMTLEEGGLDNINLCKREISDYIWVPLDELQEFCAANSIGTQISMSKQVARLHREKSLLFDSHYVKQIDAKNSCYHWF